MQHELKSMQQQVGITFIYVTHDQEEAMTMADRIVIMNHGHVEQLGTPSELYEHPRTGFVAGFLGVSNLLDATVAGDGKVRLGDGTELRVSSATLAGHGTAVRIGVRPEKLRIGSDGENTLNGTVSESAYIGVSTQYIVSTPCGDMSVYVQNDRPGMGISPGDRVTLSWGPESTFVVDAQEASS